MTERFWLSDAQWAAIEPLLPHLGGKPRVDDRRVIRASCTGFAKGCAGARSRRLGGKEVAAAEHVERQVAVAGAATSAVAFNTPTPGIVARRRAAGSRRVISANSSSKAAILVSRARH